MSDRSLVNDIYLSYRKNLLRAVSRIVPPHEVEDVVQETYVRLCQVENPENIQNPKSYLLRTVRNLALDHIKRAEHRLCSSWDEDIDLTGMSGNGADQVYQEMASREDFSHFCEAVRKLPHQCRRVFVLKKVYGYSQREIALEMDLAESTIEKHVALGIRRCAEYMNEKSQSGYLPGKAAGGRHE